MKKLALGIGTAAVLLTAAPAMAQVGIYAGPGGIGVQFDGPRNYYDGPYRGYYDYYGPGPGAAFGWRGHPEWHGHYRGHWHR